MKEIHTIYDNINFILGKDGYLIHGKGPRLHCYIWEKLNGPIQKGYVIHHIDENKLNNDISNLQLLTKSEHCKIHNTGRKKSEECINKLIMLNTKPITQEMINDKHNGMKRDEWLKKYSVSRWIWNQIKRKTPYHINSLKEV